MNKVVLPISLFCKRCGFKLKRVNLFKKAIGPYCSMCKEIKDKQVN